MAFGRRVLLADTSLATKDLYKGLNFPASDIPKQARDLYKVNKVRLLYDRDQETARLVCRITEDLETPLDLTYSYLRAMSPIHIKYLANMAVRASMSISITAFNELWGLIACHSYGQKGMRVSFPIRKMCRLVGDTASRNIERLSYASRLQARKLINTVPTESNPGGYIVASSEDLLKLFNADCGALSIREETKILGKPEQTHEVLALLEYLRMRTFGSVMTTQDVTMDFPDLRYPPGFHYIAGLLFIPLSSAGTDFIVFFRKGQLREVKWAGNPYEKFIKEGTKCYLEPRASFKMWTETTLGRCKDWMEEQIETAAVLCLVYGKFIDVWRQKESAIQKTQLTKLLLANSAHEVRTPLHQIVNFLEIALEGSLDHETREVLSKSHSASKSLIYVINDLLDLTKAEKGQDLIRDEVFDLAGTVKEATDVFQGEAKRKNIEYDVEVFPGIPQQVIGDQRRTRQVVSNVIANAIQHTTEGSVKVEVRVSQQSSEKVDVEFGIQDTGAGMSPSKVDALFRALEQVTTTEGEEGDQSSSAEIRAIAKADSEERILGLGLAVVSRLLPLMNGQLRIKSEEGKGSQFVVQLPFGVYVKDLKSRRSLTEGLEGLFATSMDSTSSAPVANPPATEGEMTLVDQSAQKTPSKNPLIRRESAESLKSQKSQKSMNSTRSARSAQSQSSQKSQKSDVDRLIDAIQEPHMRSRSPDEMKIPRIKEGRARMKRARSAGQDSPIRYQSKSFNTKNPREELSLGSESVLFRDGEEKVTDSRTPVRPIRLPDEESTLPYQLPSRAPPKVLFDIPSDIQPVEEPLSAKALRILVAEDDPINSRIVKKRLEKMGHSVFLTVNGEECASRHGENCAEFDVVLMDIQVYLSNV
jgi:light-regulated signal transduction histidine kinase (bacteriophytochrome)